MKPEHTFVSLYRLFKPFGKHTREAMKRQIRILATLIILLFTVACGSKDSETDEQSPATIEFSASRYIILDGEVSNLSWNAEGASSCTISGIYDYGEEGERKALSIEEDSEEVKLSFVIQGSLPTSTAAGPVFPDQELAILSDSGTRDISPAETTTYTITCVYEEDIISSNEIEVVISLDADGDDYPDALEEIVGTRSDDPDSDDDGILDGHEDVNRNGIVDGTETSPTNPASRNPYYCDSVRYDNEGNGLDVLSSCINPEIFSAGDRHACLIMDNGITRCWGFNQFRQLGVSGESIGDDETVAEGGKNYSHIIQVSAGGSTTCAIRNSGSVLCWGRGQNGVTGHGHENMTTFAAAEVNLPEPAIQVSTSGDHSCAVMESGDLYCWGNNSMGQLGHGDKENIGDWELPDSVGPVEIEEPVKQVSTGFGFTCALGVSGNVKCWGANSQGQIGWDVDYLTYGNFPGDDEGELPASFPLVSLHGGSTYQLSTGRHHSCAMSVGAMTCWGQGSDGKLGYGNTDNVGDDELASDYGTVSYGGGDVTNITTGGSGTCINLASGNARCWGASAFGIGYGNTDTIGDDEPSSQAGNLDFDGKHSIYIASGGGFSCALMSDKTVYCWGNNDVGQLGLGNTSSVSSALQGEVDYR